MTKFKDIYCHSCGCQMKLRDGKFGKFYGCTGYPACRETVNLRDIATYVMETSQ